MVIPAATTEAAHEVTSSEKTAEAEEALGEKHDNTKLSLLTFQYFLSP